jgi:hypothetical protein
MSNPGDGEMVDRRMKTVRKAAEDALAAIPKENWGELGAVNWGDIGVTEVRFWVNDQGGMGYTVTLEEASPGCALGPAVWDEMGSPEDVEIVCEW